MLNFENLFNFSFSSQKYSQVISYSTNSLVEQLMIPMAGPIIEEQKWSTLPSVFVYQIKNYRFQNLELVKILFLAKYEKVQKKNNFCKRNQQNLLFRTRKLDALNLWFYANQMVRFC